MPAASVENFTGNDARANEDPDQQRQPTTTIDTRARRPNTMGHPPEPAAAA
jgi:hypothetical protein